MEALSNSANKQNIVDTCSNTQALHVVTGIPPTTAAGGSTHAMLVQTPPTPRVVGLTADPSCRNTSADTSAEKLSLALLGVIQPIVSATIQGQVAALAPAHLATPSDMDAPKEEAERDIPIPVPLVDRR
ncbi:UNVERIFIED_CONTAM: hypothetical protein Sangu_3051900 [Sesamum angustifolium]|uniref:Uncharacterized protein n=1 Tax=Sesamum angustifolium TaxID=2727405 RepID=A0AAW2KF22_9LAMI